MPIEQRLQISFGTENKYYTRGRKSLGGVTPRGVSKVFNASDLKAAQNVDLSAILNMHGREKENNTVIPGAQ